MTQPERPTPLPLPFEVFVDGDPAPKGSVERNRNRGVRHTQRSKDWHAVQVDAIKREILSRHPVRDRFASSLTGEVPARPEPLQRDVAVNVDVVLRKPLTSKFDTPDAKRHGDIDKHLRSVLDALVAAGVIADDSFVVEVTATKRWAAPTERCGVRVQVTETRLSSNERAGLLAAAELERALERVLDAHGFVPMADPCGLLNVAGIETLPPLPPAVEAERTYYEDVMRARETMLANPGIRSVADLTRIDIGGLNEIGGSEHG